MMPHVNPVIISVLSLLVAIVGLILSRLIRRKVKVLVHGAYFVPAGEGSPQYYFVNITNLSLNREVEITHVWFDLDPKVYVQPPERPLPKRLKVDETWETWVPASLLGGRSAEDVYDLARVRLSNDCTFRSNENKNVPEMGFVPGGGNENR
jgi:hypothetical protein